MSVIPMPWAEGRIPNYWDQYPHRPIHLVFGTVIKVYIYVGLFRSLPFLLANFANLIPMDFTPESVLRKSPFFFKYVHLYYVLIIRLVKNQTALRGNRTPGGSSSQTRWQRPRLPLPH